MKSKRFKDFIATRTEGSVIPHLYQKDFVEFKFNKPSQVEMDQFNKTTLPLFDKIIGLKKENKRLENLKNVLIPPLMSGEIDASKVKIEE